MNENKHEPTAEGGTKTAVATATGAAIGAVTGATAKPFSTDTAPTE